MALQDEAYVPKPIDTSEVKLTPEIAALVEKLARNTHEVWARKRLRDGWSYGSQRDDAQKKHPDLVSYEDLTESERSYDLEVVSEVVKGMQALGYAIVKR
jgi:RyR domain-containing protein